MTASDLLHSLTDDGFALHIVDGNRLSVTPAARLTGTLRAAIRQHRDALVELLSPPPLTDEDHQAITEATAERAAIMEFDGKLPRERAEAEASRLMRVYQALIAMPGDSPRWITMLAPGAEIEEARRELALRFGPERVIEVQEQGAARKEAA